MEPPLAPGTEGVPGRIEQPRQPSVRPQPSGHFGRAVRWLKGYNTYIPGVSTVTGVAKLVAGVGVGIISGLVIAFGVVTAAVSVVMPMEKWSEKLRFLSRKPVGGGIALMALALKEILRGTISAVPVAGNLIIYAKDKLFGEEGRDVIADPLLKTMKKFSESPTPEEQRKKITAKIGHLREELKKIK